MKTKTIYTDEHRPVVSMDDFDILERENQSLRSELQKQKEFNAELVDGLSKLAQRIRLMMINMEYNPEQDEFFVGIESLIKKSKES